MSFITDALGITGEDPVMVDPYKASNIYSTTGSAVGGPGGSVTTTLSPELQKFYDFYLQEAMKNMPTGASKDFANAVAQYGQGLFQQGAGLDTEKMTSDYYSKVLEGLAPERKAEEARLAETLFKTGRTGYGVGDGGGYINPETYSLLKARENANIGLYLTAEDRARQIQQEKLKNAIGFVGTSNDLRSSAYTLPTSLFGTGVQLGQLNNPLIAPSLTGGQYVTGVNQTNAQAQNAANLADQSFWGGLISAGIGAVNPLGKFSNLFSSAPASNPYAALPTYSSPSSSSGSMWGGDKYYI